MNAGTPPDWEDLELNACTLAEGEMLELVLGTDGKEVGRCLARGDGTFLCEPTGPDWALALLLEAVAEWRVVTA